ncbi:MAG: flippase-like domain-containing protein [bacterium]
MKPSITVFFPCYNEEENVEKQALDVDRVLSEICEDYEVVIVDDGSTDRTPEIADRLARDHGHVRVIHHPHNLGYGTALKTGFLGARKDLVLYTDGDNQFDIHDIEKMLPLMKEGVDMVVGYRADRKDKPLRKFVSRVYNHIIRLIFGLKVRDIDCAFKLFRRSVFDRVEIKSERFLVDTEILVKSKRAGLKIVETGVTHLPREKGKSTVSPHDIFRTLRELSHLWLHIFMVNWKKLIFSSLVSAAFIILFVKNIDYRSFVGGIGKAERSWIWLGLLAYALSFWFRSIRWRILLLPERKFRISELFSGIVIGWMANNVLPVRMGELVRAYDFGRVHRFSKSLTFATIVVERLIDGLTLILFLAIVLMFVSFKPIINQIFVLGIIIFFFLFIVLFSLVAGREMGKQTGIYRLIDNMGQKYRFLKAFHLDLPAYAPFFVLCIVNLGLIVPSIGYVGTFEWFCKVALLQLAAIDPALVAGYSIALHAAQYIPVTLLGIVFFIRHNFDIVKARDEREPAAVGA